MILQVWMGTPSRRKAHVVKKSETEETQWVFKRFKVYAVPNRHGNKKEIDGSTVQNYLKIIKLFCEMADISIQWKKITRGLQKGKNYADDRPNSYRFGIAETTGLP